MVEDEHKTQETPGQPHQPSQPPEYSGRQRNFQRPRKTHSGHKGRQENYSRTGNESRPALETPADSPEKENGLEVGEGNGPARSSPQQRHYRSGRPEKRIIEESALDPYCE